MYSTGRGRHTATTYSRGRSTGARGPGGWGRLRRGGRGREVKKEEGTRETRAKRRVTGGRVRKAAEGGKG